MSVLTSESNFLYLRLRMSLIFFCKDNKNVPLKEHFYKLDLARNNLANYSFHGTLVKSACKSADDSAAGPHEQYAYDYARRQIKAECSPVALVAQHPHIVGKRRECGETAAEARYEQYVLARCHHVRLLQQAEKDAYDETADDIHHKCPHGK